MLLDFNKFPKTIWYFTLLFLLVSLTRYLLPHKVYHCHSDYKLIYFIFRSPLYCSSSFLFKSKPFSSFSNSSSISLFLWILFYSTLSLYSLSFPYKSYITKLESVVRSKLKILNIPHKLQGKKGNVPSKSENVRGLRKWNYSRNGNQFAFSTRRKARNASLVLFLLCSDINQHVILCRNEIKGLRSSKLTCSASKL